MNIVLVCGGRDFKDQKWLFEVLDSMDIDCIVHGAAVGADSLAGLWAVRNKVPEIIVPAQWNNYDRAAGPIRNGWMLKFTRVNHVVAFPGGRGTLNMIQQTEKAGVKLTEITK